MPRVYAAGIYMDLPTWPTPLNILSWPRGTGDADDAKGAQKFVADKSMRLFRLLVVADAHVALSNLRKKE